MVFVAHIVVCDIGMQSGQNTYPGTVIKLSFFLLIPLVNIAKYFLVRNNLFFPQESLSHRKTGGSAAYIVGHSFFPGPGNGDMLCSCSLSLLPVFMRKKVFLCNGGICFFVEYYFKVFISIPFR